MLDQILSFLQSGTGMTIGTFAVEAILHFVPSDKPLGIMHTISGTLKVVANAASVLASYLDKVLPQIVIAAPVVAAPVAAADPVVAPAQQ